jgi:hypothetical protein
MSSRKDPSMSKVQLLLHLRECHEWAAQACHRNIIQISALVLPRIPAQEDLPKQIDDLQYLAGQIESHIQQIDSLRDTIVCQVDLFEKRRTRIIGMLIAVYVPLAFATVSVSLKISDVRVLTRSSPSSV